MTDKNAGIDGPEPQRLQIPALHRLYTVARAADKCANVFSWLWSVRPVTSIAAFPATPYGIIGHLEAPIRSNANATGGQMAAAAVWLPNRLHDGQVA